MSSRSFVTVLLPSPFCQFADFLAWVVYSNSTTYKLKAKYTRLLFSTVVSHSLACLAFRVMLYEIQKITAISGQSHGGLLNFNPSTPRSD